MGIVDSERATDVVWVLRLWATLDAANPAGVTAFHRYFTGGVALIDRRLLLTIEEPGNRYTDTVRLAQRVINAVQRHLHVHVDELAPDLVTMPEIAERAGLTRQAVSHYVNGARGPGDFPACLNPWSKIRVWDWYSVNAWLDCVGHGQPATPLSPVDLAIVNGWLARGYSLGQRAAALVAPPPQDIRVPDSEAERLAATLLGAASDDQLEEVVTLLNTTDGPTALVEVLDPINAHMPIIDQRSWEHIKAANRVGALAAALRRELDGSVAQERRQTSVAMRMAEERSELARGYYRPDEPLGRPKVAIEVRCAGNGGRCRKLRGRAYVLPGRSPGSPLLSLSNDGLRHGGGLLEGVAKDFDGSTDVFHSFRCDHNRFVTTDPNGEDVIVEGVSVRMPLKLLKPKFDAYLASGGVVQELPWAPGVSETVYEPGAR